MAHAADKRHDNDHQTQVTDNPYSRKIAQFVSNLTYEKIPEEVRSRIKLLILDSLGCGIYGSTKEHSKLAINALSAVDSNGDCGIWGTNKRMTAPHAALINGTLVQSFELDDVHRKAGMHIGSTTLPAITAIAEIRPVLTGKRYLTAAVAGYEIGPRVGICEHALQGDGWHPGAVIGVFSGAASSASALGLNEEQTKELTLGLGERWETMRDSLKFYSAAASNHTTLDAIRIMRERHPFTVDQLDRVVVHGSQVTKDHVFWKYEPSGTTNAQFCMPYVVATLLREGDFFVDQVRDDMLEDPERIALSRKVEFIAEPEITKMGLRFHVRVEIFLKDGTHMEETIEAQRGSETKFASEADIVGKFEKLVKHVFPTRQVEAIRDAVLGLDKLDDSSKLAKLLAAK